MKKVLAIVVPTLLVAACASTGMPSLRSASSSPTYWVGASSSVEEFRHDNIVCSSRAARFGNVANTPTNRLDQPPQRWPNSVAQETYDACMAENGWRPAS